ncbi:MAG: NUDIX pyrophosphatase [Dehalococcoides mccartyi]|uniref:NUDIX pyrophosphatase n=1 Tax=Dehalococcoides mccartyi TaxID=61435 RepID=UPI000805858B|nr:NUDIX pyrophosphatase [Dehalococcoides mccartyi]OBW61275.1 MAG: NUDIX pyrophosphatase [Dehalococcoides mccartyi]
MDNQSCTQPVVTAFLIKGGKVLLFKRSQRVGSYRGCWAAISGHMDTAPLEQVYTEITEETGYEPEDLVLLKEGQVFEYHDTALGICWQIHPFLFHLKVNRQPQMDWEHVSFCWVFPAEIASLSTVPLLKEAFEILS